MEYRSLVQSNLWLVLSCLISDAIDVSSVVSDEWNEEKKNLNKIKWEVEWGNEEEIKRKTENVERKKERKKERERERVWKRD